MRIHGLGGQGAVTMATWIAKAGYEMDKHVQAFPFFGAERRGAPVKAFARISDDPINLRSQVYRADLLVVMSPDLVDLAMGEGIGEKGHLLVNGTTELAGRLAGELGRDVFYLDAVSIALKLNLEVDGMPMINLPFFGAVTRQSGIAPFEVVMKILEKPARRGNYEDYEKAARSGFEGVRVIGTDGSDREA